MPTCTDLEEAHAGGACLTVAELGADRRSIMCSWRHMASSFLQNHVSTKPLVYISSAVAMLSNYNLLLSPTVPATCAQSLRHHTHTNVTTFTGYGPRKRQ